MAAAPDASTAAAADRAVDGPPDVETDGPPDVETDGPPDVETDGSPCGEADGQADHSAQYPTTTIASFGYTSSMVVPPERLTDMPLHEITETLGEDGLRARFALEIGRFEPAQRRRLTAALGLATHLHRNDRRVREPYINHLLRVATRMMCHYEVRDTDVIVAGLLHDAVEDHGPELAADHRARLAKAATSPATETETATATATATATIDVVPEALATIEHQFGSRVRELVAAVTNPEYAPDRDPDEQYREHLAASLERNPWARVIKTSDFTDNGVGVIHTTGPKVIRAARKYRPLVPILRDMVARPDTPLSRWVKRHIFDQLDLAEERFREILDPPKHCVEA